MTDRNEEEKLYDITEVCRMLGTTSRTLRYYEEKGLIESTAVFPSTERKSTEWGSTGRKSSRRKYTEAQLAAVRGVLVLRELGLPVKSILALRLAGQKDGGTGDFTGGFTGDLTGDLQQIIRSRRAEIYASIDSSLRRINLLTAALSAIDSGKPPDTALSSPSPEECSEELTLAQTCADAILRGDTDTLYTRLSDRMKQYLPPEAYKIVRSDTFLPLGDFLSAEKITADAGLPHRYSMTARFSALGLRISLIILEGKIEGLWFGYCEYPENMNKKTMQIRDEET